MASFCQTPEFGPSEESLTAILPALLHTEEPSRRCGGMQLSSSGTRRQFFEAEDLSSSTGIRLPEFCPTPPWAVTERR